MTFCFVIYIYDITLSQFCLLMCFHHIEFCWTSGQLLTFTFHLPPGPSLQGRTRFLNRGPGIHQSLQKTQPINLDQDPDQEVVTTTKTEVTGLQYIKK